MRLYAWWNGMARQGRTGWTLLVFGTGYILYFLKARLFETGPAITNREWLTVVGMLVLVVLGTINIRMAEMRERNQKIMPLVPPTTPNRRSRK
jgi:xanthine/uracil/vitamin C permease (AzgA family)